MRISDWSSDVCSSDLGSGVDRSVGAVVGQEGKGQEEGEQAESRRRGDHQRSRDALTENGAPVGFRRRGPAACHAEIGLQAVDRADMHMRRRSEEHTYELQSLMRHSYTVFGLKNTH